MTSAIMDTIADFERFSPTPEQIDDAREYLAETGLDSLIVAVNFPGKEYGIWINGQMREAVMDRGMPAIWTDRDSALAAFSTGRCGNALFRVHSDGSVLCIAEAV